MVQERQSLPQQQVPSPEATPSLAPRPNLGASDFAAEPDPVRALLAGDPLADLFYDSLRDEPLVGVREALYSAFVGDAPGFFTLLDTTRRVAHADPAADPGAVHAGLDAGLVVLRQDPLDLELDVLLGLPEGAATVGFVHQVYGDTAPALAERLLERARESGDGQQLQRARGLLALTGHPGDSCVDRLLDFALEVDTRAMDAVDDFTGASWLTLPHRQKLEFGVGFAKGTGDMLGGLAEMALHPVEAVEGIDQLIRHVPGSPFKALHEAKQVLLGEKDWKEALFENPLERRERQRDEDLAYWKGMAGALWDPFQRSLDRDRPWEALGRGAFELATLFETGSGKLAAKADDARHLDEVALAAARDEKGTKLGQVPGVATLDQLRGALSPKAREALAQQEALVPPATFQQMQRAFTNADGTFDLARADAFFESRWLEEGEFARRVALGEAKATTKARQALETLSNHCDNTDGTARPGSTLGDGTTEAALFEEVRTGRPFKCQQGHHIKVAEALDGLEGAMKILREQLQLLSQGPITEEIEQALARATTREAKLRAAAKSWNRRGQEHPAVWTADGDSRVTPGWPGRSSLL